MVEADSLNQARTLLEQAGQANLLEQMNSWDDAKKDVLAQQVLKLDKVTPGGLKNYCERARSLLESSRNNENPFD